MNEYQQLVDTLFNIKMRKYDPDQMTDDLECELYGEAVKEALIEICTYKNNEKDD